MASDRPASERSRWRAPSKVKTPSRMRLEYGASGYEPARGHLAAGQSVSASGTIQSSPSVDKPVRRPPAAGANSAVAGAGDAHALAGIQLRRRWGNPA